jgi:large subunit ribosomal protein L32e
MKFLRRTWDRYVKLGKGSKKKQRWKKPTGRHNKMREKRRGYPDIVSIGYKTNQETRGLIFGKVPIIVRNVGDLSKISKDNVAIIGRIGKKNRIEIAKKAIEKKIEFYNLNAKKFLKKEKKKETKNDVHKEHSKVKEEIKEKENKK